MTSAGVTPQQEILQQKSARTDQGSDAGIKKNEGEADQDRQTHNRSGEIDLLNLPNVRAQARHDIQHPERQLNA